MADRRPALYVVGGWGISPELLRPWASLLEQQFSIQFVDIPDLSAGTRLEVAERNAQLLKQVREKGYWLGWSLGGAIALDLAVQNPDAVIGVITLATNPCFVAQSDWPGMAPSLFAEFLQAYGDTPVKTLQRFAALQVVGALQPRAQLRQLKAALLQPEPVLQDLLSLLAVDRRPELAKLEVPLLALFGASDSLVPVEVAATLGKVAKNLRTEVIADASHLLFQDQPEQLNQHLAQWVREQEVQTHAR